eukprot:gene9351-6574_t
MVLSLWCVPVGTPYRARERGWVEWGWWLSSAHTLCKKREKGPHGAKWSGVNACCCVVHHVFTSGSDKKNNSLPRREKNEQFVLLFLYLLDLIIICESVLASPFVDFQRVLGETGPPVLLGCWGSAGLLTSTVTSTAMSKCVYLHPQFSSPVGCVSLASIPSGEVDLARIRRISPPRPSLPPIELEGCEVGTTDSFSGQNFIGTRKGGPSLSSLSFFCYPDAGTCVELIDCLFICFSIVFLYGGFPGYDSALYAQQCLDTTQPRLSPIFTCHGNHQIARVCPLSSTGEGNVKRTPPDAAPSHLCGDLNTLGAHFPLFEAFRKELFVLGPVFRTFFFVF